MLACLGCLTPACGGGGDDGLDRQGGDTTVDDRTFDAFNHPAQNLDADGRRTFQLGSGPFDFHWRVPELGPLFNNDACLGCHAGNGRGLSEIGNGALVSQALVRASLADGTPEEPGGDVPLPGLGLQLQDHAVAGLPEVFVTLTWSELSQPYGDGTLAALRTPVVTVRRPDGTELGAGVQLSYRQAPGVLGLGLLEAVPDAALQALADPDDADGDGISGRTNEVWDPERQAVAIGRFGHKATVATLRHQVAAAFVNDIGLTNKVFPEADGRRDVADDQFDQTVFFVSTVAVPRAAQQNAAARQGRELFDDFGCASCHTPTLETGAHPIAALANQTIHPYSDLLLHDMGELLSDARRDFAADGDEWRTPPLWGIGVVQVVSPDATFLHDGRARTLAEAILWHGGEASAAREAFRNAPQQARDAVIGFLQTL
jgi:CxxC motif-containing protein (DUF1111 family)